MMAHELHRRRARRSSLGYSMVVLGAALFVITCFLPYYAVGAGGRTISLFQLLTQEPLGANSYLGAPLYLFGGVAPVATVAVVALVRGERGPVLLSVLVGAVIAWSLTWIGVLVNTGTSSIDVSLDIGFWLQAASIGVAVIGTILVGFGKRSGVKEIHDRYADWGGIDADA
jgi:hypothetical protein